jgi:UDPglucose 6-dehydrogenase
MATHSVNDRQIERLVSLVNQYASAGDNVSVLGLSYKPGTNVVEQSQGVLLAAALVQSGYRVTVHDPMANEPARAVLGAAVSVARSPQHAIESANVIVLMVPWPEYREAFAAGETAPANRVILDCWRLVSLNDASGVELVQLGRNNPVMARRAAAAAAN